VSISASAAATAKTQPVHGVTMRAEPVVAPLCGAPAEPVSGGDAAVSGGLKARAERVAAVAAKHALAADRDASFPREAIAAARAQHLLAIMVPRELGGEAAPPSDVVDVCYRLGQACSATAMIYAMHQIMVACLIRHRRDARWHDCLLRRLCTDQLLFASSTTEARGGGNVRSSDAPIVTMGSEITLERRATVISYGAESDAIVTTARRTPDAAATDQVLAVFMKNDYSLEPVVEWDTLGMRGTCSAGFVLRATGTVDQVLPEPYEKIHIQTMVPFAHLTWAGVWTGIAANAVERTRLLLRQAARSAAGQLPPGVAHFTQACGSLATLRGLLTSSVRRYTEILDDESALASPGFQTMINMVKVEASELAVSIVITALKAAGLSGYRNDTEFALGRHLRDVLSSPIMINNDRIRSNMSPVLVMSGIPTSLYE
jgi:acyl-CoA dehydrogenase